MLVQIALIILGFGLLIKGADWLVDGSSSIAKRFHIPEIIIGLTIVSIGTSMPEMFVSVTSALDGYSDMAMGNVIGSNLCNLLLILGLSAIVRPIKFQRETRLIELPMTLFFTIVFMILCNTGTGISRIDAIILLVLFIMFITYAIIMSKKGEVFDSKDKEDSEQVQVKDEKPFSMVKSIMAVIIGIVALKLGGDFTVDNSVLIAQRFNISEQIISLTILAVGTSLPELVTSVMAAMKGNSDIAIGNIIGSNIFNMLFIIGISALIKPIVYSVSYNVDMIILMVAMLVLALFPVIPPKNKMSRVNGIIYFLMYIGYLGIMLACK